MTPSNDLAIYVPWASVFYGADDGDDGDRIPVVGTGGDIQSIILARTLTARGLRVAHIVYGFDRQLGPLPDNLELVTVRTRPSARAVDKLRRMREAWQAFAAADAGVYFFRGTGADIVVGALFCALRRRVLLFSASSDLDFDLRRDDRSWLARRLYRVAIRRASIVVAQRREQAGLAERALSDGRKPLVIPSFCEELPAADERPEAFLWIGRVVDYKLPLAYVELARQLPEHRFRMVAVETGEASAGLAERLAREAARLDNLELLPLLPRDEVIALIRRSLAVVATSEAEGMPNIFLESWSAGVPVISLNFDPDGAIERERAGVAAAGSWERFVAGVEAIAGDAALRRDLGARGREFVRDHHSLDAVADAWAQLIRSALTAAPTTAASTAMP